MQVAHAPGMPGTFSPAADFKGNRKLAIPTCITARAWRTCRDACRDRAPAVTGKTFPAFPAHAHLQFCVSGKRPMGYPPFIPHCLYSLYLHVHSVHCFDKSLAFLAFKFLVNRCIIWNLSILSRNNKFILHICIPKVTVRFETLQKNFCNSFELAFLVWYMNSWILFEKDSFSISCAP